MIYQEMNFFNGEGDLVIIRCDVQYFDEVKRLMEKALGINVSGYRERYI